MTDRHGRASRLLPLLHPPHLHPVPVPQRGAGRAYSPPPNLSWLGFDSLEAGRGRSLGWPLSVGSSGGVGINTAHEMGHRRIRWSGGCQITLARSLHGHCTSAQPWPSRPKVSTGGPGVGAVRQRKEVPAPRYRRLALSRSFGGPTRHGRQNPMTYLRNDVLNVADVGGVTWGEG